MNKMNKVALGIVLIISIFSLPQVYAGYKTDADKKNQKVNGNVYIEKNAKKDRILVIDKEEIPMSYEETQIVSDKEVVNEKDIHYGKYDIYSDEDDNQYVYLSGTDKYCGFRQSNIGTIELEVNINEEQAKKIAMKYLKSLENNYYEYQLEQVIFQAWGYYYDVYFNLYVDDIKTNEEVRIWVNTVGDVVSYSDLMTKCYDDVSVDSIKFEDIKDDVEDIINEKLEGNEFEIKEHCLTYDGDKLAIQTTYSYFITDGVNYIKYEDIVMTPIED